MALYWPKEKVALDIIDDPNRRPFEGDDSYTVLRVSCADLQSYDSCCLVMKHLRELLGCDDPSTPEWDEENRALFEMLSQWNMEETIMDGAWHRPPLETDGDYARDDGSLDNIEILAPSNDVAHVMQEAARQEGREVRKVSVWEGPTPQGSYQDITPTMRMSTPEFFFFRKSNQLPFAEAIAMGLELCGKFRTVCTQYSKEEGYDFLSRPRTSKAEIQRYLRGARGTKEYKRAKRILRYVENECSSPMGAYLYMLLCLPPQRGGYGIEHPIFAAAFEGEHSFMPSSNGPFLAYDLCWPHRGIAMQYTGRTRPTKRAAAALSAGDIRAICVRDRDIANADQFDVAARKIAKALGTSVPAPDDQKWITLRNRLREQIEMPTFDGMRLTIDDISEHY